MSTLEPASTETISIDQALQQAIIHHKSGNLQSAERLYRAILKAAPNHPDTNHNLGVLTVQLQKPSAALPHFKVALEADLNQHQYWLSYIDALIQAGQSDTARQVLQQGRRQLSLKGDQVDKLELQLRLSSLALKHEKPETHQHITTVSKQKKSKQKQIKTAHSLSSTLNRSQLMNKPSQSEIHNFMDAFNTEQYAHAEQLALSITRAYPQDSFGWNALGAVLTELGKITDGLMALQKSVELVPNDAAAHSNFGKALQEAGRLGEAEASYRRAIVIKPDLAETHNNLGNVLKDLGRLDEAEVSYRQAIALNANFPEAYSNLLMALNYVAGNNDSLCLEEARNYGSLVSNKAKGRFAVWPCSIRSERLRVGLVTGDLRNHPVGHFLESILTQIDQSRIELFAYPTNIKTDDLTIRIKPYFSAWKPLIGKCDEAAARLIHEDGVNVLIDLAGHTDQNRLPVFAWKPAPVQASWLGYFATTGVTEIDYILGDPYVMPDEETWHFIEAVWRLPESYLCFTIPNDIFELKPLPALSVGYITFGCFNNLTKMNDAVVTLWANLLHAVPKSKLFLKTNQLGDPRVHDLSIRRFADCGITQDRLIFEGRSPRSELLEAYNRVDIGLDPFPFPGGTTTLEALYMGVPVITRRGDRFLSHIGESIAHNAKLSDLIADNDEEYVAKAVSYASDINKLAILRTYLRQQVLASPLFNASQFARNLENALWEMWEMWERWQSRERYQA